jgi:hypothetical protein
MITYEAVLGNTITACIADAIKLAAEHNDIVEVKFNGVTVHHAADSSPELLLRDWRRAMAEYIKGPVGPYPAVELSAEELASDAAIAQIHHQEFERREAERQARIATQMAAIEAEIAGQAMLFTAEGLEKWTKAVEVNTDWYGVGVLAYADRFARLMQARMNGDPANIAAVAEQASFDADHDEQMSGASAGIGRSMVEQCWKWGDILKAERTR